MLKKQTIALPFIKGLDTKTDPKLVESPSLSVIQNATLNKPGRMSKRPGYDALSTTAIDGTTIENIEAHGLFKTELLSFAKDKIYGYSEHAAKYVSKGTVASCVTSLEAITQNVETNLNADFDTNGTLTVYAWQTNADISSTRASIYASVFDNTTKSFLQSEIPIAAYDGDSFIRPTVIALGQYIYVFYVESSGTSILRYRRLSLAAPTTFESEQALASGTLGSSSSPYDISRFDGDRCSIVFDNGTRICFGIFDGSLSSPTFSVDTSTIGDRADTCIAVKVEPTTQNSWVFYYRQGTPQLRYFIYSSTLTSVLGVTTIGSANFPYVESITGEFLSSSQMRIFYQCAAQETRTFAPGDVTTGADTITMAGHKLCDGQKIRVSTTTTLPAPLAASTDYFVIYVDDNTIKLATSRVNALLGTAIDITTQGSGTHTLAEQNERNTTYDWNRDVRTNTITSAGVSGTAAIVEHQTGLASKAFEYDDEIYFVGWTKRSAQFVYFLFKSDGTIVGKALQDRAKEKNLGSTNSEMLSKVSVDGAAASWATVYRSQFLGELEPGAVAVPTIIYSAAVVRFDFGSVEKYFNEEPSNQTTISGSYVSTYDGAVAVESGFNIYPDSLVAETIASGGSFAAGNYGFKVVYEWKDVQGNIWQSAESGRVAVNSLASTGRVCILVPTLVHTNKSAATSPVRITIYGTATNGTLFYRQGAVSQRNAGSLTFTTPTFTNNSSAVGWTILQITDDTTDAQQGLYTDTGELENIAPPPASFVSRSKNRVYLLNSEDPQEVWFSKFNYGNNAIVFNDSLTKRLTGYGKIRCVRPMDDKIILWTENSIHYFAGDGPLDTGEQDTFTSVEFITSDTGCNNPNSLVDYPNGILFQSPKGYYALGRDLSVSYVGAAVEEFNGNLCSSATLLTDQNQVRFTCKDGAPTLVYDYYTDQWSTFTNHDANDSISWKDQFTYARQTGGQTYVQNAAKWNDNGTTYPLKFETPWIRVNNIQNFQRIRKLLLLGEFKSDHRLKVQIAYDFQDGYVDIVTWDAGAAIDASLLGSEAILGDGSLLGGQSEGVYQCSIHMPRQRCEAIKFLIEDVNDGDLLESYNISHMALEVGLKDGTYKLRSEKTAGS